MKNIKGVAVVSVEIHFKPPQSGVHYLVINNKLLIVMVENVRRSSQPVNIASLKLTHVFLWHDFYRQ